MQGMGSSYGQNLECFLRMGPYLSTCQVLRIKIGKKYKLSHLFKMNGIGTMRIAMNPRRDDAQRGSRVSYRLAAKS